MEKAALDLNDLMFGENGIAYEPGATLSERVWALAETFRRNAEKAGHVVRGQSPLLPEKAKQIVEKRGGDERD